MIGYIQPRTLLNAPYSNTVFCNFWFSASRVTGRDNSLADSLSRNNTQLFLLQMSQAMCHHSRIPPPLIKLQECNITWTTTAWTVLLKPLQQLQPPQPIQIIRQQNVDIYLFIATSISLHYLLRRHPYVILSPVQGSRAWLIPPFVAISHLL